MRQDTRKNKLAAVPNTIGSTGGRIAVSEAGGSGGMINGQTAMLTEVISAQKNAEKTFISR